MNAVRYVLVCVSVTALGWVVMGCGFGPRQEAGSGDPLLNADDGGTGDSQTGDGSDADGAPPGGETPGDSSGEGPPDEGPSSGDEGAPDDGETDGTEKSNTFVGQVEGTLALVAVVADDSQLIAYVCDGNDGPHSLSQWYQGWLNEDGSFHLEPDSAYTWGSDGGMDEPDGMDGDDGMMDDDMTSGDMMDDGMMDDEGMGDDWSGSPYGARGAFWGTLEGDRITGQIDAVNGRTLNFGALLVEDDSVAGLYVGDDGDVAVSTVVLNEHFALGLSRMRGTETLARVTPPATIPARTAVTVETVGRNVTVTPIRVPIDLGGRGIVQLPPPRVPVVPDDPSVDLGPPSRIPAPAGAIQIKFREGLTVRLPREATEPVEQNGKALVSREAKALLNEVKGGEWFRSHVVDERTLDALRENGERRTKQTLPDLNLYFNLVLPEGLSPRVYAERFRRLPEVEWAWIMPDYYLADYSEPQGTTGGQDLAYQQYLDAAPVGVDARYAWEWTGGDGSGVKVVDIETAFNAQHVDLPEITQAFDPNPLADAHNINHGTATFGVMGALDNGTGVTGIAHGAEFSFLNNAGSETYALIGAVGLDGIIVLALAGQALVPGDVILLEQQIPGPAADVGVGGQYGLVAVEWYPPNFDAIRIATANGIVVVEAAGNGSQELDKNYYLTSADAYHQPFKMENGQRVNDSGAIIVGAGFSGADWSTYTGLTAHQRHAYSNYGGRVDLHAWGDAVVTTGDGFYGAAPLDGDNLNNFILDHYGGTSSASAIMGGTVAAFQGFYKAFYGGATLSSQDMRAILRSTGTPQVGAQNIGPMPDLRAAIDAVAGSSEPVEPEDPELAQIGCQMPDIFYPDLQYDCQGVTPLPAPSWSLPSGVYQQEYIDGEDLEPFLAFLRPTWPDPWPASSVIQYTVDGSSPAKPYPCYQNCGTVRVWTKTDTNYCNSMMNVLASTMPEFNEPLVFKARIMNVAYCPQPGSVSPTVTRVYVPEGFIKEPLFDKPSSYDSTLSIRMQTGYYTNNGNPNDDYPDGFAFVSYTLDGTTPTFDPNAAPGTNSPSWPDWHDVWGWTIPIFTDDEQDEVTLKCRNYLIIEGQYIAGEVVEWTYPRLPEPPEE